MRQEQLSSLPVEESLELFLLLAERLSLQTVDLCEVGPRLQFQLCRAEGRHLPVVLPRRLPLREVHVGLAPPVEGLGVARIYPEHLVQQLERNRVLAELLRARREVQLAAQNHLTDGVPVTLALAEGPSVHRRLELLQDLLVPAQE